MTEAPRILVVEDEILAAMALEDFLIDRGYHVTLAADGEEALSILLREAAFAVVITDLRMPRMDGSRLIRELRALHPDLPVILMTGCLALDPEDEALMHAPTPIPVLRKPVSPHAIDDTVRRFLKAA